MVVIGDRRRRWVRSLSAAGCPAWRLVCFPPSGSSAGSYDPWREVTPPDVELLAVQYPGRGDRLGEAVAHTVADMAEPIVHELLELPAAPTVLFGHSLGALVAYETALRLRADDVAPRYLFVSGAAAPRQAGGGTTHLATDDALWAAVCALGGIDQDMTENPELRELVLPALRGDIAAHESYVPPDAERLNCPIRCYHSQDDPLVDAERVRGWAETTSRTFSSRTISGAHFPLDARVVVADLVSAVVAR
jgi:surfactin synthase thioesterase subunit